MNRESEIFHVLVNPASCSGAGRANWERLRPLFERSGRPYEVHYSGEGNDLEDIAREITSDGHRHRLVVAGGDGALGGVINGICDLSRVRVGLIPMGSGNDLARDICPGQSREDIVRTILRGREMRRMDLGEVIYHRQSDLQHRDVSSRRLFHDSCGIGFDAAVCEEVNRTPLKELFNRIHAGKLTYAAVAAHQVIVSPMVTMQVTKSTQTVTRHARTLFITVMIHPYEGGGFAFCPGASDHDGLLDLCGVADLNRLMFVPIFPAARAGKHQAFSGFFSGRSSAFRIRSARPLWVHTDGEVLCRSDDFTVRCLPGKLAMMN